MNINAIQERIYMFIVANDDSMANIIDAACKDMEHSA